MLCNAYFFQYVLPFSPIRRLGAVYKWRHTWGGVHQNVTIDVGEGVFESRMTSHWPKLTFRFLWKTKQSNRIIILHNLSIFYLTLFVNLINESIQLIEFNVTDAHLHKKKVELHELKKVHKRNVFKWLKWKDSTFCHAWRKSENFSFHHESTPFEFYNWNETKLQQHKQRRRFIRRDSPFRSQIWEILKNWNFQFDRSLRVETHRISVFSCQAQRDIFIKLIFDALFSEGGS